MSRDMPDLTAHPDFFVPNTARVPQDDYYNKVRGMLPKMWDMSQGHIWTQIHKPEPLCKVQGWKIHVSARFDTDEATLEIVVPLCVKHGVEMKFASDKHALAIFLGKNCARSQGGKFIAIYPHTKPLFDAIIEDLYVALKNFDGPYILSDRAYKDSKVVFYRYGGFQLIDGPYKNGSRVAYIYDENYDLIEDVRKASFHLPEFIQDELADDGVIPVTTEESSEGTPSDSVMINEFELSAAIQYSNAGGVYIGRSCDSEQKVLIKEARPYIGHAESYYATDMLEKEFRILSKIADEGIAPKPIKLFYEWNNMFFAQEFIDGMTLREYQLNESKLIHSGVSDKDAKEWIDKCVKVAINLVVSIQKLHATNIIFGDLSKNNVMVDPNDLNVKLIDFEGAYEPGVDLPVNLHTIGFAKHDRVDRNSATKIDDYYALGCVILGMLMPTTGMLGIKEDYLDCILDDLENDIGLSGGYVDCIRLLLSGDEVDLNECLSLLRSCDGRSIKAVRPVVKCAQDVMNICRKTLSGITRFYLEVMDTSQFGRVFPVGPDEHDALAVDNGSLGVAYALKVITGSLPHELIEWARLASSHGLARRRPGLMDGFAGEAWALYSFGLESEAFGALQNAGRHRELYLDKSLGFGLSGYGQSCLRMWRASKSSRWLDEAVRVADILCETAVGYQRGCSWQDPDGQDGADVGLIRGQSGIALFLLYMYCEIGNANYLQVGENALAFDLACGRESSGSLGFPANTKDSVLYPYLAFGTAGVGSVVLRYYVVTRKQEYLDFLQRIKPVVSHKYSVRADLSLGLAGLGNYLLDARDLLDDPTYVDLALNVASGIMSFAVSRPQGICFPDLRLAKLNCSYAYGASGIALFLDRLVNGRGGFNFTLDELLATDRVPVPADELDAAVAV